jgi:multidrug efflux pump subunit AcrB
MPARRTTERMTRYSLAPTDIFDALNGQNTEAGRASAPRRRSRTSSSAQHPLEGLKASFPQRIDQKINYDTTVFVTDSIREVVKTPFDASGLVVIVASPAICAPLSSAACSPRDRRHLRSPTPTRERRATPCPCEKFHVRIAPL